MRLPHNQQTKFQEGFTLLELIITVAILAIILAFAVPNMDNWQDKRGFVNGREGLVSVLSEARGTALSRNTTVRVTVTGSPGSYSAGSFLSLTPGALCNATGSWSSLGTVVLSLPKNYTLTGSAMSAACFYADGTASTGAYRISSTVSPGTATLTLTMATGVIDVAP